MAAVISTTKNSPSAIAIQYGEYRRAWWPVLLFLPGRLVFALVAQAIAAAVFAFQGSLTAWHDAAAWWPVYSTITDVLCLAALVFLTRRESMTVLDLFGVQSLKAAVRQLAWIPPYMLAVLPTVVVASVVTQAFYASPVPPIVTIVDLPASAAVYARLVWPLLWVVTEELVYIGFLLPRLEALTGKTSFAIVVVIVFWGLQHIAIPLIPDGTYLAWRLISATAAIAGFPVVFALWGRRLIPLIVIHYIADLATALMATGVLQGP
jgi:hypothetical protein